MTERSLLDIPAGREVPELIKAANRAKYPYPIRLRLDDLNRERAYSVGKLIQSCDQGFKIVPEADGWRTQKVYLS